MLRKSLMDFHQRPLFGISNLKARRYATDAIDHGAESRQPEWRAAPFNCSSSMIRRSRT